MSDAVPDISGKPRVQVQLVGKDGNAVAIVARCLRAMRLVGWTQAERRAFETEAMAGDYDNLLRVVRKYTCD